MTVFVFHFLIGSIIHFSVALSQSKQSKRTNEPRWGHHRRWWWWYLLKQINNNGRFQNLTSPTNDDYNSKHIVFFKTLRHAAGTHAVKQWQWHCPHYPHHQPTMKLLGPTLFKLPPPALPPPLQICTGWIGTKRRLFLTMDQRGDHILPNKEKNCHLYVIRYWIQKLSSWRPAVQWYFTLQIHTWLASSTSVLKSNKKIFVGNYLIN